MQFSATNSLAVQATRVHQNGPQLISRSRSNRYIKGSADSDSALSGSSTQIPK